MINRNIYGDYAMKPIPFFIRAAELRGQMDIDGRKVENITDYISLLIFHFDVHKNVTRGQRVNAET
jgi:hypothetical protein